MSPPATSAPPWGRRDRIALVAIVVLASASLAWLAHPWFDASNDAAIYIQTARALLAGDGYTWLGEPFIIRPPGFSVLIAPVIALRHGVDFAALNLYVGAWGVVCAAAIFAWARTRVSTWVAFALTAFVWTNPGFASLRNQVMSDVPGLALIFACFLLERWAERVPSWRRDLVLGLAIGASYYVRSLAVLLVPAIAMARLAADSRAPGRSWRRTVAVRIAPFALIAIAVQVPWSVRNALHHPEPPVDQNSLYDYSTGMWNTDRGDPASPKLPLSTIAARVPRHAVDALVTIGGRMQDEDVDPVNVSLGAVFVLAFLLNGWRRRETADWFALGTMALVLPYFSFQDRLLLPVLVIAVASTADLLEIAARRRLGSRAPLVPIAATFALLAVDFHPRAGWDAVRGEHETVARFCERLQPSLEPDTHLAVPMEGWRYAVYLDRPVWTLFFGWNRGAGPAGAERVIDRRGVDTILFTPFTRSDATMRPYFVQRYGVSRSGPDFELVRVR